MEKSIFKISDDPKDLEIASKCIAEKAERVKRQREICDKAKERLRPLMEEASKTKKERRAKEAVACHKEFEKM